MIFSAKIYLIGVNPYVLVPAKILKQLFQQSGRQSGSIPIKIKIQEQIFIQNLVKYAGKWRLYLNTPMRKAANKDAGDIIEINIEFDEEERLTPMHQKLETALQKNKIAKAIYDNLPPSRQKEIKRYINNLKTEESVERNVKRVISFLSGKERFIGRDRP